MSATDVAARTLCPSAQADMMDARIIGVRIGAGEATRIAYLKGREEIDADVLGKLGNLDRTMVFRYAAVCESQLCAQYSGGRCGLGARIATMLAPVVDALPPCLIRHGCRWHAEQGAPACLRCPQVTTQIGADQPRLWDVAAVPVLGSMPISRPAPTSLCCQVSDGRVPTSAP